MIYARDPSELQQTTTNTAEAKEKEGTTAVAKQEDKCCDRDPIEKNPSFKLSPTYLHKK